MKSNSKKHSLINNSLVVFLALNMIACSTIREESKNAGRSKNHSVEYSNKDVSQMIDNVVNKIVWNDDKMLYPTLNIKLQKSDAVEKFHVGSSSFDKSYKSDFIQNPARLVIDLNGKKSAFNKNIFVGSNYVSSIRLGAHPDKTRVVFDLKSSKKVWYDIVSKNDGLDIIITDNQQKLSFASNNKIQLDKVNSEINNKEKEIVKESESTKLNELANNEIEIQKTDPKELLNERKSLVKNVVSKIHCYESSDKLQVQVNVNNNVSYELNKVSSNEYDLRLKNTKLSIAADKSIALPKTYSVLNSIQASKDEDDTVIKLFVKSDSELNAKTTKKGILISESNVVKNNTDTINDTSIAQNDLKDTEAKDSTKAMIAKNDTHTDATKDSKTLAQNEDKNAKASIQREDKKLSDSNDVLKAQMDLTKLQEAKEETKEENSKLEGAIEIEDLVDDEQKGLGNSDEKASDDFEGLDEEISKLLDPASGYTGKLISLDFQDTDIDNALKIIAEVSNLNIVTSDDITGKVSLRLNNVPWDQALDVILKTNGLDKVQEGNVVRIAPVNKLKSEREELKAARQAEENLEPLQLAYRKVSYAKAAELQALVESVLSDRGSVTFDDRSNQIFIKDIKSRIKDAFEIIKKADLRTPQILLETQIIEAERNLVRELGSEFGFTVIRSNETGNGTGYNFPADITVSGSNGTGDTFSSFPSAAGSAVSFIFGSHDGSKSLSSRISGLEEEGKLKVISKPSVVTTNNTPAEIKSVETMYIKLPEGGMSVATGQGSSASGSSKAATESIDVGIILKVTPQASPDYYVLLDIMGESSHFGSREVDGVPNVVIRRATSTVLVSSGQTFALGGIYKVTDKDNVSGVPFLKDIPVLGNLFRKSGINNSDEELLFFVTPRIVEGSFDDAE